MDTRALTESGDVVVVDAAEPAPPFLRWFLTGALCTLPFHALILGLYWSFFA